MHRVLLALTLLLVAPIPAQAQDRPAASQGPRLGVQLGSVGRTVRIQGVVPGSAAAVHGLLAGDMLVSVNQVPVANVLQAVKLIQASGPAVLLRIRRGEREFDLAVAMTGGSAAAAGGGSLFDAAPAAEGDSLFDAQPASTPTKGDDSLFAPAPAREPARGPDAGASLFAPTTAAKASKLDAIAAAAPPPAQPAPVAPPPPAPPAVEAAPAGGSLFAPIEEPVPASGGGSLFEPAGAAAPPEVAATHMPPTSAGTASPMAYTGGLLQKGTVAVSYSCPSGTGGTVSAVAGQCQPLRNEFSRAVVCGDRTEIQGVCQELYTCLGKPVTSYCQYSR